MNVSKFNREWEDYRRALRYTLKPYFDSVLEKMDSQADAGGHQNPPNPMDAMFLAVFIEQEREIDELRDRIDELEAATHRKNSRNAGIVEYPEAI